jgi:Ni,Fe-hydrogenase I cytochrome b subunit
MSWELLLTVVVIGIILFIYALDKRQTREPIRRRYPVLVWGRKLLVGLGPFLRQYLFMNDQEETPYNRITRNWIYQTSQGERNTIGFGSQYDINAVGSIVFIVTVPPFG